MSSIKEFLGISRISENKFFEKWYEDSDGFHIILEEFRENYKDDGVESSLFSYENIISHEGKIIKEEIPSELYTHARTSVAAVFYTMVARDKYLKEAILASNVTNGRNVVYDNTEILWKLLGNKSLLEEIIKQNPEMLKDKSINPLSKNLKESVGLPKKVIDYFSEKVQLKNISKICEDGNDAVICMEFAKQLKFKGRRDISSELEKIFRYMLVAKEADPTLRAKQMIDYIILQTFSNSIWELDELVDTASYFADYTNARKEWGLKDKTPGNIFEAHDIATKNIVWAKNCRDKFKERMEFVGEKYDANISYKGKEYVVKAPKTVEELVSEGTQLQHCVGSWAKRISDGDAMVVFLRHAETPDESFVTMEIEDDGKHVRVVQAKGIFNSDVSDEVKNAIKVYEKKKGR